MGKKLIRVLIVSATILGLATLVRWCNRENNGITDISENALWLEGEAMIINLTPDVPMDSIRVWADEIIHRETARRERRENDEE